MDIIDRLKGALFGFAIGDAMGATTEFMDEDEIKFRYGKVEDIIGGGVVKFKGRRDYRWYSNVNLCYESFDEKWFFKF